jgi:nitrogen-specific signal transduction histidine kinase
MSLSPETQQAIESALADKDAWQSAQQTADQASAAVTQAQEAAKSDLTAAANAKAAAQKSAQAAVAALAAELSFQLSALRGAPFAPQHPQTLTMPDIGTISKWVSEALAILQLLQRMQGGQTARGLAMPSKATIQKWLRLLEQALAALADQGQ